MSDGAPIAAPAPSAPSAPLPAGGNELAIQTPVTTPTPIGPQAPEAPARDHQGSTHRPQSRREVFADAFRKAEEKGRPGPAKPGMGHNQPPEAMTKERSKPDKVKSEPSDAPLNLRKRPDKDPADATLPALKERARGEHGHFAPAAGATPGAAGVPSAQPRQVPGQQQPYGQPLQRMSEAAKRDWAQAPESVRADVHRLHREYATAYQRMRADHEEMHQLRPYQQLAHQGGTNLATVLYNFKSIEDRCRNDLLGGLEQIVWNANRITPDGHRITLQDICHFVSSMTQEQYQQLKQNNQSLSLQQQMAQQQQYIAWLAEQNRRMELRRRYNNMRRQVDRFAETHPRLDELGPAIERELGFGFDLNVAYARANTLYPPRQQAPHAAQTRTQPAQTRQQPNRSISGAPDGSRATHGSRRGNGSVPSRREALDTAMRQVGGSR